MRIFSTIIISLILVAVIIFGVGSISKVSYENTKSASYDDKIENVWKVLTTVESYLEKKNELEKIEILDKTFANISSWREIYKDGTIREYKILRKTSPKYLVLEMSDSKNKKVGVWEYLLENEDTRTKVSIKEKSENNSILWRGINTILGRDNYIDSEFKWIRVSLFNNLLN
jgi:hypothetical protein